MQTLAGALRSSSGDGRPIEVPFRQLSNLIDFRTGDLAVLAGAPGGGKSLVALNWAWKSTQPILYLAQDSYRSVINRLTSLALQQPLTNIRKSDSIYWAQRVDDMGKRQELIIAKYAHSIEDISAKIVALTEWLMEPPHMCVVDNLYNVKSTGGGYMSNEFYAEVVPELQQLAIKKDVGMLALHHTVKADDKSMGTEPLRLKDLLHAGDREAAHVWGVYRPYEKVVNVQVLKNRDGNADAKGGLYVSLDWQPESSTLTSR